MNEVTKTSTELANGVFIGIVTGVGGGGVSLIFPGDEHEPIMNARSIVALTDRDIGSEVAVSFCGGETSMPLVLGKLFVPVAPRKSFQSLLKVEIDGESQPLEITGEREITLRCGKASITLTKAGKIILRGTYISSRSSGMNRIKGGSVQLN